MKIDVKLGGVATKLCMPSYATIILQSTVEGCPASCTESRDAHFYRNLTNFNNLLINNDNFNRHSYIGP